jgi:hypothetical protein
MMKMSAFFFGQAIKLYAWEVPFQRLIFQARQQELEKLKESACLRALATAYWISAPLLVS